jgi:cytidylate kinase
MLDARCWILDGLEGFVSASSIRTSMIVTIDGPAGAGKSSAARALADRLGFRFLDTGAMYRAVALAGLRLGVPLDDPRALAALARSVTIHYRDGRLWLDGEDVSEAIRTQEVTAATHYAANNPAVRAHLVELQRVAAGNDDLVTDGRDQGTVVFPRAECKIFLTASPQERAHRRLREIQARGEQTTLEAVLADQQSRDERDSGREVGPLLPAEDAVIVCTDGMGPREVVDHLEMLVRARMCDA